MIPRKKPWVTTVRESDLMEYEQSEYGKLLREVCDEMYRLCTEERKK